MAQDTVNKPASSPIRAEDIQSIPGNSHNEKATTKPKKDIKAVIDEPVKLKKKGLGQKFKQMIVGDSAQDVGSYLLFDVMVPAAKNLFYDLVTQGAGRMMWGGAAPGQSPRYGGRPGYNDYAGTSNRFIRPSSTSNGQPMSLKQSNQAASANMQFQEILYPTRGSAERVLDSMLEALDAYNVVSVADLYTFAGVSGDYTYEKYGWTDLRDARIRQSADGWFIQFPPSKVID